MSIRLSYKLIPIRPVPLGENCVSVIMYPLSNSKKYFSSWQAEACLRQASYKQNGHPVWDGRFGDSDGSELFAQGARAGLDDGGTVVDRVVDRDGVAVGGDAAGGGGNVEAGGAQGLVFDGEAGTVVTDFGGHDGLCFFPETGEGRVGLAAAFGGDGHGVGSGTGDGAGLGQAVVAGEFGVEGGAAIEAFVASVAHAITFDTLAIDAGHVFARIGTAGEEHATCENEGTEETKCCVFHNFSNIRFNGD